MTRCMARTTVSFIVGIEVGRAVGERLTTVGVPLTSLVSYPASTNAATTLALASSLETICDKALTLTPSDRTENATSTDSPPLAAAAMMKTTPVGSMPAASARLQGGREV